MSNNEITKEEIKLMVQDMVKAELSNSKEFNEYLTPKQLSQRWGVSLKTLDRWRFNRKLPTFIKTQNVLKGGIRYPLYGDGGVLDTESKWKDDEITPQEI